MTPERIRPEDLHHPPCFRLDYIPPDRGTRYGEPIFELSGAAPAACIKGIRVRPGLGLSIANFTCTGPLSMGIEAVNAPACFCFRLEGRHLHRYRKSARNRIELMAAPGMRIISRLNHMDGEMTIPESVPQLSVGLQIAPELLAEWVADAGVVLPDEAAPLTSPRGGAACLIPGRMTPAMRSIAYQIAASAALPGTSRLFFESKALELLDLQIRALAKTPGTENPAAPSEMERLMAAREILLADLQAPPTIAGLARHVGINEFKLKKGFKAAFGTTIYAELTRHRMETAWQEICDGGMGVSEAAWHVGYTNVSHFIAAFQKRFGIRPGHLIKTKRLQNAS